MDAVDMGAVEIGGVLPFTTVDYPGKLAAVLFLKGCPLRCAYCSNPHLLEPGAAPYDEDKVLNWLAERLGKLEAVVFSGGEALMQEGAAGYVRRVKELGFLTGLHTNGFYPNKLKSTLGTLDWVGLDFKATKDTYEKLTKSKTAYEKMMESLDALLISGKDFEVRTTADPRFVTKSDLTNIAELLASKGVRSFAVQKYQPHFESESAKTTESERNQFFTDDALRNKIDGMFETVRWR